MQDDRFSPKRDFIEYSIAVNNTQKNKKDAFLKSHMPNNIRVVKEGNTRYETHLTVSPNRFKKDMNGSTFQ